MRLRVRVAAALVLVAILSTSSAATSRDIPSGASIALRCEGSLVLIVGETADDNGVGRLVGEGVKSLPQLQVNATLSPGEVTFEITPKIFHTLARKHGAGFEIGARWQIYPGAGPPATVVIEKLVLLYHGDGNQYLGALGRILNQDVANRIAGLRAAAYLAVPGPVVRGISEIPVVPDRAHFEVVKLLFDRGRELVRDDNWQTEHIADAEDMKRIRQMNRTFLAMGEWQTPEVRMWRWAPSQGKLLFFVEAVWIDEDRKLPLFAVDAVVQERGVPAILSFNYKKAEWMRVGEFSGRDWRLHPSDGDAFLNAWKIGAESFVLTYIAGYEGYAVELQRVDSAKGMVTVLGFGQ